MGVAFEQCEEVLDKAIEQLFDADPQIQAVGIARHENGFGFKAVKNIAKIVKASATAHPKPTPHAIRKVPVIIDEARSSIEHHHGVPHPLVASHIPERQQTSPLVCGLQIQNVDDDNRQRTAGALQPGFIIIGTLGCFVTLSSGKTAVLSNNHVLAAENRGLKSQDRILHPGDVNFSTAQHIATLTDFVKLNPSPPSARPAKGNVTFNDVDAAVAELQNKIKFNQAFLPSRSLPGPHGMAKARVGDKVLKVGRTTGLTHGEITSISLTVGPIDYDPGPCWFRQQIEIVGDNGTLFSDHGDSGSAILSTTGEVVGLLYAGNGKQTYACPIQLVMTALNCALA